MNAMGKLLSSSQVAEWLGMTEAWVQAHASGSRKPILPGMKMGKSWRFESSAVQRFIVECEALARDAVIRKSRTRSRAA